MTGSGPYASFLARKTCGQEQSDRQWLLPLDNFGAFSDWGLTPAQLQLQGGQFTALKGSNGSADVFSHTDEAQVGDMKSEARLRSE